MCLRILVDHQEPAAAFAAVLDLARAHRRCEVNTTTMANGIAVFDATGVPLMNFASAGTQSTPSSSTTFFPFAIDAVETNTRKAFLVSAVPGFGGGWVQQVSY